MTIIAMTREMGTLGKDVAAGLAQALDLTVIHQELVEHHVAARLQLGESTVHRFLEGRPSMWERWKIDSDRMSRYTADEILQLAHGGNVLIRGWGAAQLLRDVSHVLCVRVCAPMSQRVSVMKERLGVTDSRSMRDEIEQNDNAHTQTIQRQFGDDWRNPENYDIVLNSGFVAVDTCIALITQLAKSPTYQETAESRRALADKVIETEVRKILDGSATDTPFGPGINITVEGGKIRLGGVVGGHREIDASLNKIRQIEGVTEIENDIAFVPINSGV